MKKKVLQLIHGFTMGGAETLVKEYSLKLDKNKYDVHVLCFYQYESVYEKILENAGVKITFIDKYSNYQNANNIRYFIGYIRRYWYIKNFIRREQPDIIHSHLTVNSYVAFAKPKKGTKIIHTVHNEPKRLWRNSFFRRIDFYAARKLVKKYKMQFITLHEEMKHEINQMFSVKNAIVLNNGIDFERFENTLTRESVRKREGIPEHAYVVGHIGRFGKQKNHRFLIEIFKKIKERKSNAYLLLIGNGPLEKEIKKQLKELGLEEDYKILSYRNDIPDLLNVMDVFVFPSIFEGLGIVLIEAQKMKRKCVISNAVPDAVLVSNLVKKLDLKSSAEEWADEIINFNVLEVQYRDLEEWDMKCVVRHLEEIYS